jgi:hypothetical protein
MKKLTAKVAIFSVLALFVFSCTRKSDPKSLSTSKVNYVYAKGEINIKSYFGSSDTIKSFTSLVDSPYRYESVINTWNTTNASSDTLQLITNVLDSVNGPSLPEVFNDTILVYSGIARFFQTVFALPYRAEPSMIFLTPVQFEQCSFTTTDTIVNFFLIKNLYFHHPVEFNNNVYRHFPYYSNNVFEEDFAFFNDQLHENLIANDSAKRKYYKSPYFRWCIFNRDAIFSNQKRLFNRNHGSTFYQDLTFYQCIFKKRLDFSNCSLKDCKLILSECSLPDTLDLSNMEIAGSGLIDLLENNSRQANKKCELFLSNTNASKIKLQYNDFHLNFPDSIIDNERFRDNVSNVYESLLVNLKANGYERSYTTLDIEYKDWQSRHNLNMWISNWWWKYGYEKWRVIFVSLILLLLFSAVNKRIYNQLMETYKVESLDWNNFTFSKRRMIRELKKFQLSFFYTSFIFFKLGLDFKLIKFQNTWYVMLLFFEYLLGLLCTAYLINWILGK